MYNNTDRHVAQSCVTSTESGLVWGWDIIAPRSEDRDYVIEVGCAAGRSPNKGEIEADFEKTRRAAEAFAASLGSYSFDEFDTGQKAVFEVVVNDQTVGFKTTTHTPGMAEPLVEYVYLNPSTGGDSPDVFVYKGSAFDPGVDSPVCFVSVGPGSEEGRPKQTPRAQRDELVRTEVSTLMLLVDEVVDYLTVYDSMYEPFDVEKLRQARDKVLGVFRTGN